MTISEGQIRNIDIVSCTFGSVSLLCSLFTVALIAISKKWTGYLLLLLSLTLSQILYDINYIMRISRTPDICLLSFFLDIWGGLGLSFWTNILAFVVAYTVLASASVKIFHHYALFSLYGTVLPIVLALIVVCVPNVVSNDDNGNSNDCHYSSGDIGSFVYNVYYWGRFGAIFLTIILCSVSFLRLRTMRRELEGAGSFQSSSVTADNSSQNTTKVVFMTVSRMNYYAIAQVLCRSGAAWNEWNYGAYSTYSSSLAAAVCSPSTGIFNFIIFLVRGYVIYFLFFLSEFIICL